MDRTHDLVRPRPGSEGRPALLGDLIAILLAPYDDMGAISGRIRVSVPRMGVGEAAATTLALVVHQFATNSLKYGALSVPLGTLDVSCSSQEGVVVVSWTERGGPPVVKPPGPGGYESKLLDRAMPRQSDGSINRQWNEAGAIVTLTMNKAYLVTWRLKAVRSDGD